MYARKRLDITWSDLVAGLTYVARPGSRQRCERAVETRFEAAPGQGFACLSVRSGFDLLLGQMNWAEGDEVIMTAVSIPAMGEIIRHHGLGPVPIDISIGQVRPDMDAVEAAIGPRTRAIVVAHLFGTHIDLEPFADLARKYDLMLIEDCAQAYEGRPPAESSVADVSMYSFGTIKTATAFGGAVFTIRDPKLKEAMSAAQDAYPVASRWSYCVKLLKYMMLMLLSLPFCYGLFARFLGALGKDHDELVRRMTRGFSGPHFFTAIRHRPCAPNLALLHRRLRRYDPGVVAARRACGEELATALSPNIAFFGHRAAYHIYWLFALVVDNPEEVIDALRAAGFDATTGSSTLAVIEPDVDDAPCLPQARHGMERIVYLPLYPEIPALRRRQMASIINETARATTYGEVPAGLPLAA